MSDNVECAGGGDARRRVVAPAPCGWKGERFAVGRRVGVPYFRWDDQDRIARTRQPCPHCGGRVALIGEQASR